MRKGNDCREKAIITDAIPKRGLIYEISGERSGAGALGAISKAVLSDLSARS